MTEVDTAYKRYQLAHTEFSKSAKLSQNGSVSAHSHNRTKYSMEVAQLEYHAAQKARELAATEAAVEQVRVQAAQASIARHIVKSPIVGVVVEQKREEGEWVTAGDTIMRLARMDRLRVPAIVEGDDYDPHEIANRPVTVTLTLARGREVEFTGKIVFAGIEKRLGNKYMVWAEVDNRMVDGTNHWMLQPGCVVDMRIHLQDAPLQSASAGNTTQSRKN
jgi:multidrug resistance efflux pump